MPQRITPEYSAVPSVRPEGPPGLREGIQVHFPEVHLTGAVGEAMAAVGRGYGTLGKATEYTAHALDSLGAQFEKTGNQLWDRAVGLQQLENETEEKKRLIEYDRYATDKRLEYDMKLGDAVNKDTLKAFQDDLEAKRQQLKTGLPPSSQRSFDNNSIATAARDGIHAATHTASQMRQAAVGTSEASIKIAMDRFGKSDTPQDAQYYMDQVFKEIHNTYGPAQGWTQEQMDVEYQKRVGQMLATKFTSMADNDPTTGMVLLEENRHLMPEETYVRVKHSLQEGMERQQSRNIGDEVEEKMKDANLEDKIKEAKRRAAELDPKNPELATKAADRVRVAHDLGRKETREQREKDFFFAKDAAWGYTTPGGTKPTTHEELFVDPKVKEAYMNLKNPSDRHAIDAILVTNGKDDYPETRAGRERWQELLGMANPDAMSVHQQREFIQMNLWEEKIPNKWRDHLFDLQRKLRAKPMAENPMIDQAMRVMKPYLPDSIGRGTSPTLKNQYMGALYIALQEAQAAKGKIPLTKDEMKEIGTDLLQSSTEISGWRSNWETPAISKWFQRPLFEQMRDVPSDFRQGLKATNPGIKDETILDLWSKSRLNMKMQELQDTVAPKKPAGPTAPPPAPVPSSK